MVSAADRIQHTNGTVDRFAAIVPDEVLLISSRPDFVGKMIGRAEYDLEMF